MITEFVVDSKHFLLIVSIKIENTTSSVKERNKI